jgi:hypothetical protein
LYIINPGRVVQTCNPSTWEKEAEGSIVQDWATQQDPVSNKRQNLAGQLWLMLVILATQDTDQEDQVSKPREIVHKTLSRKYLTQKGLAEWLKVKAPS